MREMTWLTWLKRKLKKNREIQRANLTKVYRRQSRIC